MYDQPSVVILDDLFPSATTGFRIAEFNYMLEDGVAQQVLTTVGAHEELVEKYSRSFPHLASKIRPYSSEHLDGYELAYINFLNNASYFLDDLEGKNLPFVVTLYPGGGLNFELPEQLEKLDRVLSSKLLRRVITTQPMVTELVSARISKEIVTEIYGVPINPRYFVPGAGVRFDYPASNRDILRICFAAHRYTSDGADKGFEDFLICASELHAAGLSLEISLVGPWSPEDVDTRFSGLPITYCGEISAVLLREFFISQHLLISLNKPGILAPGAFDGFPLTTVVEAALSGVALVMTDEMIQNRDFVDGRDAIIASADPAKASLRILEILSHPGALREMAQCGLRRVRVSHSLVAQLEPRVLLLRESLAN